MPQPAGHKVFPFRSQYRVLALIGSGQFGQVYCGVSRETGGLVALKNLHPKRFPTHLFIRELRLLVESQHPNIVAFHGLDYAHSRRYLVMDYCEGGTLRDWMESDVLFGLVQQLSLIADVLRGLAYAHQANIIHCDLKPENILLTLTSQGWMAKISDFGIARLQQETQTSVMGLGATGSPAYMAPERFYGKFSMASDLYAVGVILYELLTGDRPFSGKPGELMSAHLNEPVIFPDNAVPFVLRSLISKALEKLPHNRFERAQDMLHTLELAIDVLAHEQRGTANLSWRPIAPSENAILPLAPIAPDDSPTMDVSPDLGWSVSITPTEPQPHESPDASSRCQLLIQTASGSKVMQLEDSASQVVLLDCRHAIAVIPDPKTATTKFLVLNRRGQQIGVLQLPALFSSVTASLAMPRNHLFAVVQSPEQVGLFIHLRPYQLHQCPLIFSPDWQVATPWGLLLANAAGQIVGLDWQGHWLGTRQVPLTEHQSLTAFSVIHDWQVAIAITDLNQTRSVELELRQAFEPRLQALNV
jgi:serine/threonine protein kinase